MPSREVGIEPWYKQESGKISCVKCRPFVLLFGNVEIDVHNTLLYIKYIYNIPIGIVKITPTKLIYIHPLIN